MWPQVGVQAHRNWKAAIRLGFFRLRRRTAALASRPRRRPRRRCRRGCRPAARGPGPSAARDRRAELQMERRVGQELEADGAQADADDSADDRLHHRRPDGLRLPRRAAGDHADQRTHHGASQIRQDRRRPTETQRPNPIPPPTTAPFTRPRITRTMMNCASATPDIYLVTHGEYSRIRSGCVVSQVGENARTTEARRRTLVRVDGGERRQRVAI